MEIEIFSNLHDKPIKLHNFSHLLLRYLTNNNFVYIQASSQIEKPSEKTIYGDF